MSEAVCPACGEDIQFEENFQVGHNTVCPNCKELLAVVMTEPLIFDLYSFSNPAPTWFDSDKKEAAKKHERRAKHHHEDPEDLDDDEYFLKKSSKKNRNKNRREW